MVLLVAIVAWGLMGISGSGLRGRVVDDRGEPVGRFLVETRRTDDRRNEWQPRSRSERRLSAHAFSGDGSFELPDMAAGSWTISVLGPGDTESALQVVKVGEASDELRFVLSRPARIAGRVVDGSGTPIAHASIFVACSGEKLRSLQGEHSALTPRTHTDAEGRFELDGLNPR